MGWTHLICDDCWKKLRPDIEPYRINPQDNELQLCFLCCFCGEETASGIYIRYNPAELKCKCE